MPRLHNSSEGDQVIKWGVVEKVLGGIITTLATGSMAAVIGLFVRTAVIEEKVDRHDTLLREGGRYTESDAEADRQLRATHEAAVLNALTNIQQEQTVQGRILANIEARLLNVEDDIKNEREERIRLQNRIDN